MVMTKLKQSSTAYGTDSCGILMECEKKLKYVRLHQFSSTVAFQGAGNDIIYSN